VNGHSINAVLNSTDESDQRFCDKCGATTTTICQHCGVGIRGRYRESLIFAPYVPPNYCHRCGKPYPWTDATLRAARELADELDELTPEQRETLKGSLDDLVVDTPRTGLAATRFKSIVAKLGPVVAQGFKEILLDVMTDSAKRLIWP
jgi:hypothetical protein